MMKLLTLALFSNSVLALAVAPAPQHYWGMAQTHKPDGGYSSTLVLGKRWTDGDVERDAQMYVSPTDGVAEYTYEFHKKTGKMTVLKGDAKVGDGTFKCIEGRKGNAKHTCSFDYTITGEGGYRAVGSDRMGENGLYYAERADVTYPKVKNKEKWAGDYHPVEQSVYDSYKAKLK